MSTSHRVVIVCRSNNCSLIGAVVNWNQSAVIVDPSHGCFLDRSRIQNFSTKTCRGSLLRSGRILHEMMILQQMSFLIASDLWTQGVGIRALSPFLLWCWRRLWFPVVTVTPSVDHCNRVSDFCFGLIVTQLKVIARGWSLCK